MKILLTVLFACFLFVQPVASSARIGDVLTRITINMDDRVEHCSAFQVKPGTYFTAAHCFDDGTPEIDGHPVEPLLVDKLTDLAVFRSHTRLPSVLPLGKEPKAGDSVNMIGYSVIPDVPVFFSATILATTAAPLEGMPKLMIFNHNTLAGMSGGPVVDKTGKFVSVVQGGGGQDGPLHLIGGGVTYFTVEQAYRRYGQVPQ